MSGSGHSGEHPRSRIDGLCALVVRTLPIDGASVVLVNADHRVLLTSTGEVLARLEEAVHVCGEGPAVDATSAGRPVLASDLADETSRQRWPVFSNEALGVGAAAVFVVPLQIGVIHLGVLVVYRDRPGPLAHQEFSELLRVADATAFAVLDLMIPIPTESPPSSDPRSVGVDAVGGRGPATGDDGGDAESVDEIGGVDAGFISAEIHQASGMVMVQLGVPIATALARLRAHAFAEQRPLIEVARAVVERQLIFRPGRDVIETGRDVTDTGRDVTDTGRDVTDTGGDITETDRQ